MNIRMTYLYRDAGNYKYWQDVVLSNKQNLTVDQLTSEIKKRLHSGEFFDTGLAPLPFEYSEIYDRELDHSWLEFHSFTETSDQPQVAQDVMEFVQSLRVLDND